MNSYDSSRRAISGSAGVPQVKRADRLSPTSPVPTVHKVVSHLARRFNQLCMGVMTEVTVPAGLMPQEYGVIASLYDMPGLDQRGLADCLAIDAMTVTQHIDKLERMGLVSRSTPAEDRRVRRLHLTKEGHALRRRLRPRMTAAHDRILGSLSSEEQGVFLNLLTRVIEANQAYARPGAGRRLPRRST
jgi:DNA-binding MarR family transcriptional regulator